jgi:predicted DNA repair protein MutK
MAASSLLALIDDIATILDDVAVMSKVAAKKTAGVLGDDLALNAQQVAGVKAERELPVVWAVGKGSMVNKVILVPAALAISALASWAITPLLMLGGAYLCYEGFEKLAHRFLHSREEDSAHEHELAAALADPALDLAALERDKIKGAIRTDFVLSAEIIVIALGTVADAAFGKQVAVLSGIAVLMTIGVYGLVAGIVKLDDAGLHLSNTAGPGAMGRLQSRVGEGLLLAAPLLMKFLSVAGTIAMFMVGGGILTHGMPFLHDGIHHMTQWLATLAVAGGVGGVMQTIASSLLDASAGVVAGALVLLVVQGAQRLYRRAAA